MNALIVTLHIEIHPKDPTHQRNHLLSKSVGSLPPTETKIGIHHLLDTLAVQIGQLLLRLHQMMYRVNLLGTLS